MQIDLYEPNNKLGGRIATVEIANRFYESGASILHPKNMYAKAIAEKFGKIVIFKRFFLSRKVSGMFLFEYGS